MSDKVTTPNCDLENRIFEYKLKSLQSFRGDTFIVEVNNQVVCVNKHQQMVLTNEPFPTEFKRHELETVKQKIHGVQPVVKTAKDFYTSKLQLAKRLLGINSIIGGL